MTLGTSDRDCQLRLSPVHYTCAGYTDFYWVSSPGARHSRNIVQRPAVEIVIFDSTVPVGTGEAVYVSATAGVVPDDRLDHLAPEALRPDLLTPDEVRGLGLRLYIAHAQSCEVHVPGGHPVHGRGLDTRQPADPTSPAAA
jgi:Pyridoxamine 5'-phosphate oxidase